MWWKKHKWKVIIPVLMAAVLAGVFYYGGNAPGSRGWSVADTPASSAGMTARVTETPDTAADEPVQDGEKESTETSSPEESAPPTDGQEQTPDLEEKAGPAESTQEINPETGKDNYLTDPVPEGKPLPVEPQEVKVAVTAHTCTISISCATILDNMDLCNPEKVELVPEEGWILEPIVVTFNEGESVFDVLRRTCKEHKIHLEYMNTPVYNSAYIEGIHNLYEFDVGELSGWMYKVNDWFPNYGCSRYQVQAGDVIEWVYTCDLGFDVGGGYAMGE
ncbi:hypothetical protein SDC9_21096 [bioreactor metagenome]|uniref:Transcobalamin-like C-terminal domain-containing protein n=2 Tax=root TaxID=1 RepID=A0A0W1JCI7_DESHA|nr:DUF4430 domain-containing protein [Desulfitobacterium hafniense]KTE89385.1 hypothetical protein AT727_13385 [Desulfitobacterium hafniense]MEA5023420.1 DUF4430 domain-containing protein [Desulfitobacterium hafniense]